MLMKALSKRIEDMDIGDQQPYRIVNIEQGTDANSFHLNF